MAYAHRLGTGGPSSVPSSKTVRLTALEWAAIMVAKHDSMCSLHPRNAVSRVIFLLFGGDHSSLPLADPRLEALRRAAVYAWHGHDGLPAGERAAFAAAGYSDADFVSLTAGVNRHSGRVPS